ncbi:MAG: hypothetical protein WDN69_00370 [Aliidongia sp.]
MTGALSGDAIAFACGTPCTITLALGLAADHAEPDHRWRHAGQCPSSTAPASFRASWGHDKSCSF